MSAEKACFWCGARGGFAHSTWCQHYRRPPMPALPAVLCASYPAPAPREKHAFTMTERAPRRILACGCVLGYERCFDCRPGLHPDQEKALAISIKRADGEKDQSR